MFKKLYIFVIFILFLLAFNGCGLMITGGAIFAINSMNEENSLKINKYG